MPQNSRKLPPGERAQATAAAEGRHDPLPAGSGHASGSLFGLAYGDSLGRETEFCSVEQIIARHGPDGPHDLDGQPALVTDDTQMALAVAWALHDAQQHNPQVLEPLLRRRFVDWLDSPDNDRAPGRTCLAACADLARGLPWRQASVIGSKGCGANMRVTPVGLVPGYDPDILAGVAQLQAGLTHGHPTALAASELTAYAVWLLRHGVDVGELPPLLADRCRNERGNYRGDWLGDLWRHSHDPTPEHFIARGWDECLAAIHRVDQALNSGDDGGDVCRHAGAGWVAEESLAVALLSVLWHPGDPVAALARAATTSGDSDSIAALAGALIGAAQGMPAWPARWQAQIEYRDELVALGSAWD